jgi:hypothetical protein
MLLRLLLYFCKNRLISRVCWGGWGLGLWAYRIDISHEIRCMKLVLQIFLKRKCSLRIIRIRQKNRFHGGTIVLNISIMRYNVREYPALTCRNIWAIFGTSCIFEWLIHIGWPLISLIISLHLARPRHLDNKVFVDGYRSHYNRSDRLSLIIRKGNLLFCRSIKDNLLLFEVIAVSPLIWVRRCLLGIVMNVVELKSTDLLVVDLLIGVSR